ncbi:MAG: pirin family protein [Flavobacteriaceae bacterium]|nr:pirin family protein [Flavobacteriaceae bacterium]
MLQIITKDNQANGNFNNGKILEKKPIGFPHDGGIIKPYSNLFYWAHAWTPYEKSTIGLHPHQGFEICSFVLSGYINHFDTKLNKWIKLEKGSVQVIKSGSGISHSEEIGKDSSIFQIWFDPNIALSITNEAEYSDYNVDIFPTFSNPDFDKKIIKGQNSTLNLLSENILINKYNFKSSSIKIDLKVNSYHSWFILAGSANINDQYLKKGDFLIIKNEEVIEIEDIEKLVVFEIISPITLSYKSYFERFS